MNMKKYLELNYTKMRTLVRKVTKNHQNADDLFNDLVLTLLEKPAEYQLDLLQKNKVPHWFTSSAKMQYASKTSPFFYKYKKFAMKSNELHTWKYQAEEVEEEGIDAIEMLEYIKTEVNLYNVYTRTLLTEHLLNGKSFSEISREYKINRKYVSETIRPAKEKIYIKLKAIWKKD